MLNEQNLRNLFEKAYDRKQWYEVLKQNFGAEKLKSPPTDITSRIKSNAYKAKAFELGSFETPKGQLVGLYEVQAQNTQLHRNRVALRELLKDIYNNDVDAALVVFVQDSKWRFTYISEISERDASGKRVVKKTDHKRYTYLLGEGEKALTAARQFSKVKTEENLFAKGLSLEALQEAFNVEKMSKAFFNEYRKHYGAFTAFLTGEDENSKEVGKASPLLRSTFNGNKKEARDFVKKMLGRIVFLYFLEKKGWLGVPIDSAWGKGDENFLSNLFKKSGDKDAFYSNVLAPLFFNALNTERKDDVFKLSTGEKVKIPFLNGGLFEEDEINTQLLAFPKTLFANLFEFFDQYNFTVYEDSPDEHTVAVDPEMLGHIFENLLEDNKEKGAYYTPKEIVHYMCQESLIEYLNTKLKPQEEREKVKRDSIEKFIKNHEAAAIIEWDESILKALKEVKVCDPAIGSGAFPMGILMEIFHAVETLFYANPDTVNAIWKLGNDNLVFNAAKAKESIIQNSIYGVDVEKGAVDIARLRFWLSLVVDETKPKPLPNLDYKIVVGNSLLSKFEHEVIDIDWNIKYKNASTVEKLVLDQQKKLALLPIRQDLYFNVTGDKTNLQSEIRSLKIDILINQLRLTKISFNENTPKLGGFAPTPKEIQENVKNELVLAGYDNAIQMLEALKKDKKALLDFFDWKLDFPEVMNEKVAKGESGFDIVIANPPYVRHEEIMKLKPLLKDRYKVYTGTSDLLVYFFELALRGLKPSGTLTMITSNKWMQAGYGKPLRGLLSNQKLKQILDFGDSQLFESATTYTCITVLTKDEPDGKLKAGVIKKTSKDTDFAQIIEDRMVEISANNFKADPWFIQTGSTSDLLDKVVGKFDKLEKYLEGEAHYGIKTGFTEAFLVDETDRKKYIKQHPASKKLLKPVVRGRSIQRWYTEKDTVSLIGTFPALDLRIDDFPPIKQHLLAFSKKRLEQSGAPGSRKKSSYKWFETQDGIQYWREFEKPKIMYQKFQVKPCFVFDDAGLYCNDSMWIIARDDKALLGILNSKMGWWLISKFCTPIQNGYQLIWKYFSQIPIPDTDNKLGRFIEKEVLKIIEVRKENKNEDVSKLEAKIDLLVYHLYNLTYDEASLIEGNSDWVAKDVYENLSLATKAKLV